MMLSWGCASILPGHDPVVVRAEQSLQIAFTTFDTFLKLEHDNKARVKEKVPEVHKFAEWLREPVQFEGKSVPRGVSIIQSANNVKTAYKRNRTEANKANLVTALAAVESAVREAQKHLTQIN
jgi:hypothetical protein